MATYLDRIPYLMTRTMKVALPPFDDTNKRSRYGSLIFMMTPSVGDSIKMINNDKTCHHDHKYHYYYYNLLYRGSIAGRRYNIKDITERKRVYERVTKETPLTAHPPSLLNKTPNYNCYFEMSKYIEIYKFMTSKYSAIRKVELYWAFFKSIWFSEQTSTYLKKTVLINADTYANFGPTIKSNIDNPIYILWYTMFKRFDLIEKLDLDFVIYSGTSVLKVNPSLCDKKSYLDFKRELNKIMVKAKSSAAFDETAVDNEVRKETIKTTFTDKFNFIGDDNDTEEVTSLTKSDEKPKTDSQKKKEELSKKIDTKIDKEVSNATKELKDAEPTIDMTSKPADEFVKSVATTKVENDTDLAGELFDFIKKDKVPVKPLSTARDAELRKKQAKVNLDNVSLETLDKVNMSRHKIPERDVSKNMKTINTNMKKIKFANANKSYIEDVLKSDIMKVFTFLNDKSYPLYVKDVKVEDTSDPLNYKETYKVTLVDGSGAPSIITFDIPKFLDYKFMYLGGNKKIINKQNFLFPVVKTAPDTVQIVSNYNKMFIRRLGTKSISAVDRFMKLISNNEECMAFFIRGNNSIQNRQFLTTIEYDEFSKVFTKFDNKTSKIFFNQGEATDYANHKAIEIPEGHMFIGVSHGKNIFIDTDTQMTDDNKTICDILFDELPENLQKEFSKTRNTKKLMYNTVTIMAQTIPFVVLLVYWEGIESLFKKMKLSFYFSKSYPKELKTDENVIKFNDCYVCYKETLANALLLNGLKVLDTENYDFAEYNTIEPFMDYFKKVYGKLSITNALTNAYEFTIDPITKEILEDIDLPTDLLELCIYANNLLADESYTIENSQTLSRVRSTEIIPAILFSEISDAYVNYKNAAGKKKLSVQKDCVIKKLLGLQTVEDYSTLNPVVELEKDRAITSKGFRGINVERAYTEEKRSYDDSMIGIISMDTSPDGNCGINRFLTMEPNITSARGYVDIKANKREELSDVNLFSPAELLYPLGNTRDDSIRTAMACKQSKHVIPVKNASPALMSNGADEIIKYELSSDFVIIAEEDGTVVDFDEKSGVMMVEYKSGKHRAIDLSVNIVKNGGGGFFLGNSLITRYKVGDKFRKDDTLAYHKDFFKDDGINGVRMNVGVLEKVAIASSYNTYNDSTVITEKLANDAAAEVTFCKPVVVGKNSNIYDIRKVGDHVSIGDPLIAFDVSFDDGDLNKLLAKLSEDNKETLNEGSSNVVKSKYAGKIIDIKIYSTVELEELSPSLKTIVSKYYNKINHKKQFVSKYDKNNTSIVRCGLLLNETTGKVEPNVYGVVKGQKVEDAVLIEFYIEHGDTMGVGDKLAYFTALKSIVGEVIPKGLEPYSEFRPDEEVSSLIGPSAILKRQVPSILLTVLGNKVIVELKRSLKDIYES